MKQSKKLNEGIRIAKEVIEECWDDMGGQDMTNGEQGEQMSVTISMPGKNISVTTDSADEIGNILRLAGITMGGASEEMPSEMPVEEPSIMYVGAQDMGNEPEQSEQPVAGDNDGDGDHDMHDHEIEGGDDSEEEESEEEEDEVEEATQTPSSWTDKQGEQHPATKVQGDRYGNQDDKEEKDKPTSMYKKNAIIDKDELDEAAGEVDFEKVLEAIAALYGDDMWENDAMQDLADDLMQAGPTDQELDFIIANSKLPSRLANTQFTNNDSVQFGESARILQLAGITNEAQSAAQKAAFKAMIAKKNGGKSDDKASDKADGDKKPDADGDGVPDWADKDKEVKEEAPATNSIFGQGVYEQSYARILELAGVAESKLMNSPANTSMAEPKIYHSLPSGKGTGAGRKDYGANRANNQGENPMGPADAVDQVYGSSPKASVEEAFTTAMGEYRKFVAEKIATKK